MFKNRERVPSGIKGELYSYEDEGFKLQDATYLLHRDSNRDVRFGVVCQLISEGASLTSVVQGGVDWAPTEYEFYLWLGNNKSYKHAYHNAKILRSHGVIERLYQHIEKADVVQLDEEAMKHQLSILKQISQALAKEIDDDDKNIVHVKVIGLE